MGFKVIIAVDSSKQASEAFDYYVENLHKPGNDVIVLHTVEIPYMGTYPLREELVNDLIKHSMDAAKPLQDTYQTKISQSGITATYRSGLGRLGHHVVEVATEESANMIVMGTRGMGTIRRTIMGSVSDYVIHHAHCPVTICRK